MCKEGKRFWGWRERRNKEWLFVKGKSGEGGSGKGGSEKSTKGLESWFRNETDS